MWNHTSFPAYKSRLWDMTGASTASESNAAEKRKPYVPHRTSSHIVSPTNSMFVQAFQVKRPPSFWLHCDLPLYLLPSPAHSPSASLDPSWHCHLIIFSSIQREAFHHFASVPSTVLMSCLRYASRCTIMPYTRGRGAQFDTSVFCAISRWHGPLSIFTLIAAFARDLIFLDIVVRMEYIWFDLFAERKNN